MDFAALDRKDILWINYRNSSQGELGDEDKALNFELETLKHELQEELIQTIHLPLDLIFSDHEGNPVGVLCMFKSDNSLSRLSEEVLRSLGFPFITVTANEVT